MDQTLTNLAERLKQTRYSTVATKAGFILLAILFVFVSVSSGAEPPRIDAAVSVDEIYVGESFDYQVEISNSERPPAPDLSAIKELFDVDPAGDQSRNQSSTFIVNGRVTQKSVFSHVYFYRLKPKQAGQLTIPPAKATVDGKSLASNSLVVRVQQAEDQDIAIMELLVSNDEVFPTQSFSVTLRILLKPLPDGVQDPLKAIRRRPPSLQVDWVDPPEGLLAEDKSEWLKSMLSRNGVGFSMNEYSTQSGAIFDSPRQALFDLQTGRESRKDLNGNSVNYFVYELKREFTAAKTGTYSFGPTSVKGTFVSGIDGQEYQGKRLVAIAPAKQVIVKDVPSDRPKTFNGGIGRYKVSATASPTKLRVGDPLTLTLEFSRGKNGGSLELLSAPNLADIPEIADSFDIIDANPTGRIEGDTKKFAFAMRPKRAGVSIAPIPMVTFEPSDQKFVELQTQPIAIEVGEASKVSSTDLVGAVTNSNSNDIKLSSRGIFQNITDPAMVRNERASIQQGVIVVGTVWCLSLIGIAAVSYSRRYSADTVGQRRQRASRIAIAKLRDASNMQKQGNAKEALRNIRSAMIGLVADSKNRIVEGLTSQDVLATLETAKVSETDRLSVAKLLSTLEAAEYGASPDMNIEELISQAEALVNSMAPILGRSSR